MEEGLTDADTVKSRLQCRFKQFEAAGATNCGNVYRVATAALSVAQISGYVRRGGPLPRFWVLLAPDARCNTYFPHLITDTL